MDIGARLMGPSSLGGSRFCQHIAAEPASVLAAEAATVPIAEPAAAPTAQPAVALVAVPAAVPAAIPAAEPSAGPALPLLPYRRQGGTNSGQSPLG